MAETWMKCTECRTEIAYGATYWQCSVSTCNRSRMPLYFCSVVCWDSHLSTVRHRDAYAVEVQAPSKDAWAREQAANPPEPVRPQAQTPDRPPESPRPGASSAPTPPAPAFRSNPSGSTAQVSTAAPQRRVVGDSSPTTAAAVEGNVQLAEVTDKDILIVISKLKKYIKDRSGFNTSDAVAEGLSDHVRAICDEAIRAAARDERKTVLDRDVPRLRR